MSAVVFHSQPMSVYLWTATLAAEEKGVGWSVNVIDPGSAEHYAINPFAKSPVLEHGDVRLYETLAITHYLDRAFDGPALQPTDALGQAQVLRWASLVNSFVFPSMTNGIAKERLLVPSQGGKADEARIVEAVKEAEIQMGVISADLDGHPFLVGEALSIADCFLFPHLHFTSMTPEGQALLGRFPKVAVWLDMMRVRPSFAATDQLARRAA